MGDDYHGRIAVLGVTNEEIHASGGWRNQVLFIKSNITHPDLPTLHKVPTHEVCEMRHGHPFCSEATRLSMTFPYQDDLIRKARVNGHIVELYRATSCNDIQFSRREMDQYDKLVHEVIALSQCRLVMPERRKALRFINALFRGAYYEVKETKWDLKGQIRKVPVLPDTPCRLFLNDTHKYKKDEDGKRVEIEIGKRVGHEIGKQIEERFGLEQLGVHHGISTHRFRLAKDVKDAFYCKYPHGYRATDELTLRRFCDMMYDLVRIRHNYLPL